MRVHRTLEGSEAQIADKITNCIERIRFYAHLTETKTSEIRRSGLQLYLLLQISCLFSKQNCTVK